MLIQRKLKVNLFSVYAPLLLWKKTISIRFYTIKRLIKDIYTIILQSYKMNQISLTGDVLDINSIVVLIGRIEKQ